MNLHEICGLDFNPSRDLFSGCHDDSPTSHSTRLTLMTVSVFNFVPFAICHLLITVERALIWGCQKFGQQTKLSLASNTKMLSLIIIIISIPTNTHTESPRRSEIPRENCLLLIGKDSARFAFSSPSSSLSP